MKPIEQPSPEDLDAAAFSLYGVSVSSKSRADREWKGTLLESDTRAHAAGCERVSTWLWSLWRQMVGPEYNGAKAPDLDDGGSVKLCDRCARKVQA